MLVVFLHLAILRLGINVLFLIHVRKSGQRKNLTNSFNIALYSVVKVLRP